MDWTGGARRRFAAGGRNHATLQKQKAHFAKVRGTLQDSSNTQRTFKPEYYGAKHSRRPEEDAMMQHGRPRTPKTPMQQATRKSSPSQADPSTIQARSAGVAHIAAPIRLHRPPRSGNIEKGNSLFPLPKRDSILLTEAEQLHANKQHLLARTDWLGLSKKRSAPIIRFPSASERDQVGRRRKIRKSPHCSKPAGPRVHTPLFEARMPNADALMSGALPAHDVDIRIGTDALATQTAPSRYSQPSRHTSMRQPSTEFGPLSEESMLLGDDGDSCELNQAPMESVVGRVAIGEGPATTARCEASAFHDGEDFRQAQDAHDDSLQATDLPDQHYAKDGYLSELQHVVEASQGSNRDVDDLLWRHLDSRTRPAKLEATDPSTQAHQHGLSVKVDTVQDLGGRFIDHMHDEDRWRVTVGIPQDSSSHISAAALKSSSMHQTDSDNDHRAAASIERARIDQHLPLLSTPRGHGTQITAFRNAEQEDPSRSSTDQSAPASLKIYDRLSKRPSRPMESTTWEADKTNALWREFCGVDDYNSESSEQPLRVGEHDRSGEARFAANNTSEFEANVRGLDTSVNGTAGQPDWADSSASDVRSRVLSRPKHHELGSFCNSAQRHDRAKSSTGDSRWSNFLAGAEPSRSPPDELPPLDWEHYTLSPTKHEQ